MLEHHDYEAIPKEIYNELKKWYGVDIDIVRFLKTDPMDANKLFLEKYPSFIITS